MTRVHQELELYYNYTSYYVPFASFNSFIPLENRDTRKCCRHIISQEEEEEEEEEEEFEN